MPARGPSQGQSGRPSRGPGGRPSQESSRGPSQGQSRGPERSFGRGNPQGSPRGAAYGSSRGADRGSRRGPSRDTSRGPGRDFAADDERSQPPLPSNPREAALRILHAADTRSAFSDRLLEGAHARGGPDPRDRALMHELVKGTLRWRGRIDWALDRLVHVGFGQLPPWVRNVLRMGAYQILFLDRIPPHAAVDESVKLANKYGHPGTAGLVNSVLRRLVEQKDTLEFPAGDDPEALSVWGSHPRWIVERWLAAFGPEQTRALMTANNRSIRVGLRVNALRGTRDQLLARLAADGVEASPATMSPDLVWVDSHHAPGTLAAFREGLCTVQDESEALVTRLVDPRRHERVLDLCAAPGGKCTHLAERMEDDGEVWAMERNESRMPSLTASIERLGMHSVHVVQGDGRTYIFPMPFDRVLVDAPCSGLGVLGRRADARWRKGPEVLREMPPIQLELLVAGGKRARPGGVLVYSVCSFEPEETTHVVERFLRENPQFVIESAAEILPAEVLGEDGFMRVLPHIHGCDGAFAARFRKT